MNYFELYGISPRFENDPAELRKKFYELSRKYHPDRFAGNNENSLAETMDLSALNNEAFRTLKDKDLTLAYILKLEGVINEEDQQPQLSPAFLMEMMDLNEAIDEGEKEQAQKTWQEANDVLQNEIDQRTSKFDNGDHNAALLLELKELYYQKKYLNRIKERLRE